MKRFITLVLFICLMANGLFAQKKTDNTIQPYFTITTGYTATSIGRVVPLNFEYQYRYKRIGIGASLGIEYATYKYGSLNQRLHEVGDTVRDNAFLLFGRHTYQSTEHWLNLTSSLLGYYYLGKKKKWEGFFKTGIVANYNAHYSYKGYEYKLEKSAIVIDKGPIPVIETKNSIDLQSINWLIGGGFQYKLNKRTAFRMTSEMQWGRGISILGGVVFKL